MAVNQRRSESGAAMRRRLLKCAQAHHRIVAVHLGKVEVGKVGHQPGDVSARRIHLNGNADGVAVVLHAEDHRQLLIRRGVDRLPELALRGRALAHAGQHHLVAVEVHIAEGAIVAFRFGGRFGMAAECPPSLCAAHGVQQLRRRRRRRADDMQRAAAPVRRHLPAAACRIGSRAHGLQHHLVGRNAQRQAQRAIAIVGKEPVVAGTQGQRRAHLQRLVARGRNLEEDLLLAFEEDFAVVHRAGEKHQPVDFNHLLRGQLVRGRMRSGRTSAGNCHFHSGRPPYAKPESVSSGVAATPARLTQRVGLAHCQSGEGDSHLAGRTLFRIPP